MDIVTYKLSQKYADKVAAGFSSVRVDGLDIIFTLNDGKTATVTVPAPKDGVSITNVSLNQQSHLICTLSDGTAIDAGLVHQGVDGKDGKDGVDGAPGQDGKDGITPTIGDNGNWYLGDTDTGKPSRGVQGEQGIQGIQGPQGIQGVAGVGITSITKTSTSGNVDTYTILFTNNSTTTFQITNGDDYVLTNADKQEIASIVLEAAGDGDEVYY